MVVAACQQYLATGPHPGSVYSRYVHLLWIPVLPFGKTGRVRGNDCMATQP